MNKLNIFKKITIGITAIVAGVLISGGVTVQAAIPYTGDDTVSSPTPAFNVFTGVPAPWGDESDFLRARVPVNGQDSDATTQYVDPLAASCANGQKIQMRVYVHNGASVTGNQNGTGPSVAHDTKVRVDLKNATAQSVFAPNATISSSNAGVVNDGLTINCNGKTVKLNYLKGSASSFSLGTGVVPLDDAIVTTGVPIRSQSVPGDVWGCWNDRVYVVLSVQVEELPPPPITPPATPPPAKPVPQALPKTGPGDVAGIFTVTTIAGALVHRYALSRRYQ